MTGWPTDCMADSLAGWLNDWLAEWLTGWLSDWLAGWMTDWLAEWLAGWMTDWLTDWPTDCLRRTHFLFRISQFLIWSINPSYFIKPQFITMFTTARNWCPVRSRWIQLSVKIYFNVITTSTAMLCKWCLASDVLQVMPCKWCLASDVFRLPQQNAVCISVVPSVFP